MTSRSPSQRRAGKTEPDERTVVVDDRCLRSILLNEVSHQLARRLRDRHVVTTSTWLYRLAQAVRSDRLGALSGPIASLPLDLQTQIVRRIIELPPEVGILSGRELAWTMAGLVQTHRLNYLALEALATAKVTNATLLVSEQAESPLLLAACKAEKVAVLTIA